MIVSQLGAQFAWNPRVIGLWGKDVGVLSYAIPNFASVTEMAFKIVCVTLNPAY